MQAEWLFFYFHIFSDFILYIYSLFYCVIVEFILIKKDKVIVFVI